MENPGAIGGRRRGATKHSAEDQALDQIAKEVRFNLVKMFLLYATNSVLILVKVYFELTAILNSKTVSLSQSAPVYLSLVCMSVSCSIG
jgi:hypothetical protein